MSELRPFASASAAWLWCRGHVIARGDGRGVRLDRSDGRPCDPEDILRHLQAMCDAGEMTLADARVIARFGDLQRPPVGQDEKPESRVWHRVMDALEERLVAAGIVVRRAA